MAQVNIRVDDDIKEKADILFSEMGLNMTTAFNIFVRQVVRQGGLPFEVTTKVDPFYSASNMRVLLQSIQAADAGKLTKHDLAEG